MNADMRVLKSMAPAAALALTVILASPAMAQAQSYDEQYQQYLSTARGLPAAVRPLWMADLTSDRNARHVNDLVTIRVIESLSATGSADSNVGKASDADVFIPGTQAAKVLSKFVPNSAETQFSGSGNTTRTTELTATMTARVTEVLPNGDLVVEGVREVDINGDRSLVVLSGVVRAVDILPGNVVPSSRVGQLRIRALSQGLIKDSLKPGWLIRILNKIF
jgi:flagellar L-ring protein precursor FlgH